MAFPDIPAMIDAAHIMRLARGAEVRRRSTNACEAIDGRTVTCVAKQSPHAGIVQPVEGAHWSECDT